MRACVRACARAHVRVCVCVCVCVCVPYDTRRRAYARVLLVAPVFEVFVVVLQIKPDLITLNMTGTILGDTRYTVNFFCYFVFLF